MKSKIKVGFKPKNKSFLLKRILSLMLNRAGFKQYCLEIGVYLLKKGVGYDIGQILQEKHLHEKTYRVKVVTGIFYSFKDNKITHTAENRIIKAK